MNSSMSTTPLPNSFLGQRAVFLNQIIAPVIRTLMPEPDHLLIGSVPSQVGSQTSVVNELKRSLLRSSPSVVADVVQRQAEARETQKMRQQLHDELELLKALDERLQPQPSSTPSLSPLPVQDNSPRHN